MSRDEVFDQTARKINQAIYRVSVSLPLTEGEPVVVEDVSKLTAQMILDKLNEFVVSDPFDEHYIIFLHYLALYPVSMCSRNVSPLLKLLIGFHYRFGQMYQEKFKPVKPVSMEDLSQIFGRSKATIHECIKATEEQWKGFLEVKEREEQIEKEARRELIEEAKERLRKEKTDAQAS